MRCISSQRRSASASEAGWPGAACHQTRSPATSSGVSEVGSGVAVATAESMMSMTVQSASIAIPRG